MISLIIPPKDQISRVSKMLADEFGTASNIKSRVNRLSVLGAITSVQHRLKLYTKVPPNGLVIYCGTIVTEEGKEKKVNIDFEPFKPINTSLYLCDNKFHTEALTALLADDNKFGFIVMDGNGALFGTLQGNTREVLHKFTVDLPKKHGSFCVDAALPARFPSIEGVTEAILRNSLESRGTSCLDLLCRLKMLAFSGEKTKKVWGGHIWAVGRLWKSWDAGLGQVAVHKKGGVSRNFWSPVSTFGTIFAHTLRMFKCSVTIS
ncbi:Electron transfer flavoprotein alpha-subunit [Homalodisca vitripennis]|nr:Electron transfer flavoprotein alpha-subunit [Homalodisca vitripennis]